MRNFRLVEIFSFFCEPYLGRPSRLSPLEHEVTLSLSEQAMVKNLSSLGHGSNIDLNLDNEMVENLLRILYTRQ